MSRSYEPLLLLYCGEDRLVKGVMDRNSRYQNM
jgi:hypothetical protein